MAATAYAGTYSGGDGSAEYPYKIATPNDLNDIGNHPKDFNDCFILVNDINMADFTYTTALIARDRNNSSHGFQGTPFTGSFDGNDLTVSNLIIDTADTDKDFLGLFGKTGSGAIIENLDIKDSNITGSGESYWLGILCGENNGTISNCCVTGSIYGGDEARWLGGLCGENLGVSISNCYATVYVSGYRHLGGLVGMNNSNISNCYSTGDITGGDTSINLGGLCGYNDKGTIINSYATGSVSGGYWCSAFGGLCGGNYGGSISNSYATGSVSGYSYLGGLCGDNDGTISNCYATGPVSGADDSSWLGGLCGANRDNEISNCYATGSVTAGVGSDYLGGLCGEIFGGTISNCYFLEGCGPDNGIGTPLIDEEMKQQNSFTGWDFITPIWMICEYKTYPKLWWEGLSCGKYGGSGTAEDPYQIATPTDLNSIGNYPNDWSKHFILINDIDMAGYSYSNALIAPDTNNSSSGFQGTVFNGSFDGDGYVISNLTIDTFDAGNDFLGLFGWIETGSSVVSLGLEDVSVTGADFSEYIGGLCGSNYGTISNCSVIGSVSGGVDSWILGGLCGGNWDGTVTNCYASGSVTGGDESWFLGGLCGADTGTISRCYSTGSVTGGEDSRYLGGLCGRNDYGEIASCYSTGFVTSGYDSLYLGGLCGSNAGETGNCYAAGSVTAGVGSDYLGGLCGSIEYGTISGCYFLDPGDGGGPDNGLGTALTDVQMKQQNSFSGWDFVGETVNGPDDIWTIHEDVNYPEHVWPLVNLVGWHGVDFADYAFFANYWMDTNCGDVNDCNGVDFDFSNAVDTNDLKIFCDHWLEGAEP